MFNRKWVITVLMIGILIINGCFPAGAAESKTIDLNASLRVGLKELYEMKQSLILENAAIQLGYEEEGIWEKEWEFESSEGFTFTPATGFVLASVQAWSDYTDCNEQKNILREQGFEACTATISKGVWKIYFPGFPAEADAIAFGTTVEGLSGLNYEILPDNGLRTQMSYSDNDPLVMDNEALHAQFETDEMTNSVAVLDLGDRSYRGRLEIGRFNKAGVTAINIVSITEYLYGVVASEMPQAWPEEALKAQAVSARNFSIYNSQIIKKYPNEAYSICDTVNTEVYKGFTNESVRTNAAVDATRNVLVYYGGEVVPTFFFSTSGGHTENSENVWSGTLGYVKGKPDLFETEPAKVPWIQNITAEDVKAILMKYSIDIGDITDISVTQYSDSGRAMTLNITGTTGTYELVKETMRAWLGLKSRKFEIIKPLDSAMAQLSVQGNEESVNIDIGTVYVLGADGEATALAQNDALSVFGPDNIYNLPRLAGSEGSFIFVGQGNGHGAGMSQSGAKGMAEEGYTYKEILQYYFTDVIVR